MYCSRSRCCSLVVVDLSGRAMVDWKKVGVALIDDEGARADTS